MQLTGLNYIGSKTSGNGDKTFQSSDPALNQLLEPKFHESTVAEIDEAMRASQAAFVIYSKKTAKERAAFLNAIAAEMEALGDELLNKAVQETALPLARITGERGRTTGQLRMFANLIEEGSWVDARIDHALPDRKPLPKSDIRRMKVPMGPVVVFGASNFPLAFSACGGDTASALASGCTVVVKGHPSHPATSELTIQAVIKAAQATGMPDGVVSLIQGVSHDVSTGLVKHPLTTAVGFTGSLRAGRALFDAAAARANPIPVYAEMGSINPVFILPEAMKQRGTQIAEALKNSFTLGVGQFCTNPGLVVVVDDAATNAFIEQFAAHVLPAAVGTMLNSGIASAFARGVCTVAETMGVKVLSKSTNAGTLPTHAVAVAFVTTAETLLKDHRLSEELFGPSTLIVKAAGVAQLLEVASHLQGQLTATIHGTTAELLDHSGLQNILVQKAGRLVFNGFPTGVEVCPSMHHGGPYPSTSDTRSTSVGTAAIERFARPVCFQDFPDASLPTELQEANPKKIWRTVDGKLSQ